MFERNVMPYGSFLKSTTVLISEKLQNSQTEHSFKMSTTCDDLCLCHTISTRSKEKHDYRFNSTVGGQITKTSIYPVFMWDAANLDLQCQSPALQTVAPLGPEKVTHFASLLGENNKNIKNQRRTDLKYEQVVLTLNSAMTHASTVTSKRGSCLCLVIFGAPEGFLNLVRTS